MAAGDTVGIFYPENNNPPASAAAIPDTRNAHPVLDFNADADRSAVFPGLMPRNYAGGGVQVILHWMATTATTGDVKWDVQWEQSTGQDIDSDGFAAAQTATATTHGTSGIATETTIAFTNGAQMDSVVAGNAYRLKVTRDADAAGDTMLNDAELFRVEVRETPA